VLSGRDVTGWAPHRISRLGLARTFQGVRMFTRLTVLENVEAAAAGAGLRRAHARRRAGALLERMGLSDRADERPGSLSAGIERRLGIVRALAGEPRFLLLDEPAAGMNEAETDQLLSDLSVIREDFGCGVLLIEHDMRLIMRLCERIQVLDYGKTLAVGTPEEIRTDPAVLEAYLGTG
jgi:branched-chain amino acid transport system ATP-binding protein